MSDNRKVDRMAPVRRFLWTAGVVGALLLLGIAGVALVDSQRARSQQPAAKPAEQWMVAVDGDTLKRGGKSYRLTGFDAPETFHARCVSEYEKGMAASHRLQEIIQAGAVLEPTGRDCKYGRECARLTLRGVDVAEIMVKEGLAVPYFGKGKRRDWCN